MSRLVLLAGWGCDARIWKALDAHWPRDFEVRTPDWPGYGERAALGDPGALDALAGAMADDLPRDAVWVGWSLGGLLATALLDRLPAPRALVLLGMGARFCHPEGVSETQLATFRAAFRRDPDAARTHFLRWQLGGEPAPRAAYRRLQSLLGETAPASRATLAAGLDQLAALDNGARLAEASCPVHRLAGASDPLLAPAARDSADGLLPQTGHCPMLSQAEPLAHLLAGIADAPERRPTATEDSP